MWAVDSVQEEDETGRPIGPAPQTVLEAVFSLNTLVSTHDIVRAEGRELEEPNRLKLIKLPAERSPCILLLRGTSTAVLDLFRAWLKSHFDCFVKVRELAPLELQDLTRLLVLRSLEINASAPNQTASLKRALQRPVELTLAIPDTMGITGVKTIHVSFTRTELVALAEEVIRAFDAAPGNRSCGDANSTASVSDERLGGTIVKMMLSHVSNLLKIDLALMNLAKIATPVGVASLGGNFRVRLRFECKSHSLFFAEITSFFIDFEEFQRFVPVLASGHRPVILSTA